MHAKTSTTLLAISLLALPFISGNNARGQSSLFSIPTTDVLEKGSTYFEADFDANLFRPSAERWQSFGAMVIRGVGRRSEIGLNVYSVRTSGGFEPLELQPNFKFNVYQNESNGFSLS